MKSIVCCGMGLLLGLDALAGVRLEGRAGESAERCIQARTATEWARGAMYEEAVQAFRTHWDDSNGRTGWQNEYWGKTMLSFAGAAAYTGDRELAQWIVGRTHAFLDEFQKPNGYLSTHAKEDWLGFPTANLQPKRVWCFNIWGRKYTLWALLDIYRTTGDARAKAAAVKMGDHLVAQLRRLNKTLDATGSWHGISSMSILRPLLELYRVEPKREYLELARSAVDAMSRPNGGPGAIIANALRKEAIVNWYPEPGYWAKAYETMSCLEGLVDYYRLTGDRRAIDGVLAYYGHLEREELNSVGSVGHFDHFYGAGKQFNGLTELCDVIHWLRLNRELLLLTGERKYADRIEETFFNAFLAGVMRDGRWGAHIIKSHGSRHLWAPPQTGMFHHQCCPDNMLRGYFDYASVCATATNDTITLAMYNDLTAETAAGRVTVRGGYPWGETPVSVTVTAPRPVKMRFRRPGWSRTMRIDGQEVSGTSGWVERPCAAWVTTFVLAFDLSPRVLAPANYGAPKMPPSPQASPSVTDVGAFTVYNMELYCPEMRGRVRTCSAFRVVRGPLLLAKARLAGETCGRTFATFSPQNGFAGWRAKLETQLPEVANSGAGTAWNLTLERGVERETYRVTDFASASNVNDPENWFSVWY